MAKIKGLINQGNAEEAAAASEQLNAQAETMKGYVNQLQELIGAKAAVAASSNENCPATSERPGPLTPTASSRGQTLGQGSGRSRPRLPGTTQAGSDQGALALYPDELEEF